MKISCSIVRPNMLSNFSGKWYAYLEFDGWDISTKMFETEKELKAAIRKFKKAIKEEF